MLGNVKCLIKLRKTLRVYTGKRFAEDAGPFVTFLRSPDLFPGMKSLFVQSGLNCLSEVATFPTNRGRTRKYFGHGDISSYYGTLLIFLQCVPAK